jgi:small subunit ribosomal protein S20
MPHTRSAAKNLRKSEKRRAHNRATKSTIKNEIKDFQAALASGKMDDAKKEFVIAVKKLDKAAAKRIIHPNLASRKKSQLQRMLNQKAGAKPASK